MKPWKCAACSAWNAAKAKRCGACSASRQRVAVADSPALAARQAAVCAAVPGLASVFAEIARGMRSFAAFHERDVATFQPETIVTPGGKVVVDLNSA